MFMVALLTGSLATRLKDNAKQSARAAYRTKILFETNQLLQKEKVWLIYDFAVYRRATLEIVEKGHRDLFVRWKEVGGPHHFPDAGQ